MLSTLFRGARVVDGSGAPAFLADVGIRGDRIAVIGRLDGLAAERSFDVHGLTLSPGFVDVHAHSDLPLLRAAHNEPKLRQGVTTELLGADGLSFALLDAPRRAEVVQYLRGLYGALPPDEPAWRTMGEFLQRFHERAAPNVFAVVPHQALRLMSRGWRGGPANEAEVESMASALQTALDEGALGLGTGLDYFPVTGADTRELLRLAAVVAGSEGVLVAHVRYRDLGVVEAVREVCTVAERTGVRLLLSHLRNPEALEVIEASCRRGADVWFDSYPYHAGSSLLQAFLPDWVHEGGPSSLLSRLEDPVVRTRLKARPHARLMGDRTSILLTYLDAPSLRGLEGRSLASVMDERGTDAVDTVCDLLLETDLAAGWLAFSGTEEDLRQCMQHPRHMVSSDGILVGSYPHPRGWGTYPRYLGRYVRELGWLSLEACVRKMSTLPAECFGLGNRGSVREGAAADLVVFDADRVLDAATYERPRQYPVGIAYVMVNGRLVVEPGGCTGALPGRALGRGR